MVQRKTKYLEHIAQRLFGGALYVLDRRGVDFDGDYNFWIGGLVTAAAAKLSMSGKTPHSIERQALLPLFARNTSFRRSNY